MCSSDHRFLSIINNDTGLYTLLGVNPAGMHSDSIYLDVQGICNYYCFTNKHTHALGLNDSKIFNYHNILFNVFVKFMSCTETEIVSSFRCGDVFDRRV